MARIDYSREKQFAQKELMKAANAFASVRMRLEGTPYYGQCSRIMGEMTALNTALVADIRKEAGK